VLEASHQFLDLLDQHRVLEDFRRPCLRVGAEGVHVVLRGFELLLGDEALVAELEQLDFDVQEDSFVQNLQTICKNTYIIPLMIKKVNMT